MPIEIYYTGGGPFAWRCLLALAVKRLDYTPMILDLSRGDTKTPEFLKLNPRGTLPVLRDGPIVVRESQAIMFYLDRAYPSIPLYGRTPKEAARIMQEINEQGSYLEALLRKVIGPLLFGAGQLNVSEVVNLLHAELTRLNDQLAEEAWIAGDKISAADINLYPFLPTFERALAKPAATELAAAFSGIEKTYPRILRWMRAIQSLDGYAKSLPSPGSS